MENRPPDDLVRACLSKQCVLFAGAGLSMAAGMPSPLRLAEGLYEESRKRSAFVVCFPVLATRELNQKASDLYSWVRASGN